MSHPMQNPYPPPPHNAAPPGPPPPQQAPYPPMPPQGQYVQYSPQQPPTHPHPHPHQQPGPPPGPPQPQYYAQPMQPQPHQSPYGVSQPPHMYPPPHHQTHWVPHPHAHPQQHMMQPHHPQQQMAPHQMPPNYPPHNQPPPPPGPHYQMPPSQYVPHPQYAQTHHPQAPHPHYYPPQPMPPQPPHPSPYGVSQPPQMYPPHPQPHWGQHAPPPPHTAPHPPPPHPHAPHPHPQQQMMHHPQQQMPHPPQPSPYYHQPPHQPQPQPPHPHMVQSSQQPPPPSPNHYHHHPSRNHTPQQTPPPNHTPVKVVPQCPTPVTPTSVPKVEKKDIISFPKNSVEATKPVAIKKRKFTSKDVTDIEVWRLLMCLKSGLLAESSWAIDVLSILLNDDSTIMHFGLQHTPGLLEAVLEHFKCCLNDIYNGIVSDTMLKSMISESKPSEMSPVKKENEVTTTTSSKPNNHNNNNNNVSNNNNIIEVKNVINNNNNINGIKDDSIVSKVVINKKKISDVVDEISPKIPIPNLNDQIVMFTSKKNYTFKSRDGKIVKLKNGEAPVQDEPTYELTFKPVGYSHWQEGNGEDTSHILGFFQPKNFMELSRRCTCLSTILRNLSFIPGNDVEMSRHAGLLLVLGRLLLLKHDDDVVHTEADSAPSEWSLLSSLREDTLVIISNISSSLDLSPYNDKINLSLLDGLLHWACCNSSYALDPFPPPSVTVTPQRLALESLAKLSIIEGNVDLLLATPPWSRIEQLFEVLARLLSTNEDQTIREFSLVLLSNLTAADSGIARKVALTGTAIPRLISFLEMSLADPETYSTTQDMLRRAALTLKCISQLVDNHPLFAQYQPRLLNLVMSQKLDMEVVPIIADVIFEISLSD